MGDTVLTEMEPSLLFLETSPERAARILVDDLYACKFPAVPGVEIGTAYRPRPNGGSIILYVKGRTFIVGQRILRLMSNFFVLVMYRRSLPQYLEEKQ